MSDLVRTCTCGHANPESEIFCSKCGADISGISPTTMASTATQSAATDISHALPGGQKKCQKCDTINEGYALACSRAGCGAAFSEAAQTGTAPTAAMPVKHQDARGASIGTAAAKAGAGRRIFLLAGSQVFDCKDGDILGREGSVACPVFATAGKEVSRRHALLNYQDGGWFLVPLSPNITELDGKDLPKNQPSPISAGEHVLRLSTKCEVRLRVELVQTCL